jgi:hypothetical protein
MERRMRLGIQVNQANALTLLGQCRAEIDRRRRFSDTTLLVQNGNRTHD